MAGIRIPSYEDNSDRASLMNARSFVLLIISAYVGEVSSEWSWLVLPCSCPMIFSVVIVPDRCGEHSSGPGCLKCKNIAKECWQPAEKSNSDVV